MLVGDVDEVQVKARRRRSELPADMNLAVVGPGRRATRAPREAPAIDTAEPGEPGSTGTEDYEQRVAEDGRPTA